MEVGTANGAHFLIAPSDNIGYCVALWICD